MSLGKDLVADSQAVPALEAVLSFTKERQAFHEAALKRRLDTRQHPLHFLFADKQTSKFRDGWKAALDYVRRSVSRLGDEPRCLPDEGHYILRFEDKDVADIVFSGCGAREAAIGAFERYGQSFHCHLFIAFASSSRAVRESGALLGGF